jgi:hypothetical protein
MMSLLAIWDENASGLFAQHLPFQYEDVLDTFITAACSTNNTISVPTTPFRLLDLPAGV